MPGPDWTPKEDEILAEFYADPMKTIDELHLELPGRTKNAIRLRASRTGLHRSYLLAEISSPDLTLPRWVRDALI